VNLPCNVSDADNFEPVKPIIPVDIVGGAKLNKWEGEDEEENIKVSQLVRLNGSKKKINVLATFYYYLN